HMVPKTYRILHSGKRVLCLETELTDMGFWVGNKGILYYVEGNACNACPEYYALYSLDGNKLWHMYTLEKTSGQSWLQEKDNYNKIIRQFDIESHDIKVKSILPIGQEIEYSSQVIKPK
ncbi:MAG: hypothetical protein Q8859_13935, partial [Bacteroidota bacterium]|nr:hypothetical protein [Bacteroidota bacterium]